MSVYQESICCANHVQELSGCYSHRDLQIETYDLANEFSIADRNIIRKLSKQYRIFSIQKYEDIYFREGLNRIVQQRPWIIKYQNWETNDPCFRPFEWEFYTQY